MSDKHRAVDLFVVGLPGDGRNPGGWGAVLRYGEHARELKGCNPAPSVPQRLLSTAVATSLNALTRPVPVRLHAERHHLTHAAISSNGVPWAGPPDGLDGARAAQLARDALREAVEILEARCRHDLVIGQCWQCHPAARACPDPGKVTSGGLVFHLDEGCTALHDGWRRLDRRGGIRSDLTSIPTVDALAKGLGACEVCCRGMTL